MQFIEYDNLRFEKFLSLRTRRRVTQIFFFFIIMTYDHRTTRIHMSLTSERNRWK